MEVKFHLPGLRQNYPLNMLILSLMEQKPEFSGRAFRSRLSSANFRHPSGTVADPPTTTNAMLIMCGTLSKTLMRREFPCGIPIPICC